MPHPRQLRLPYVDSDRPDRPGAKAVLPYTYSIVSGMYELRSPRGTTVKWASSNDTVRVKDLNAILYVADMLGVSAIPCKKK